MSYGVQVYNNNNVAQFNNEFLEAFIIQGTYLTYSSNNHNYSIISELDNSITVRLASFYIVNSPVNVMVKWHYYIENRLSIYFDEKEPFIRQPRYNIGPNPTPPRQLYVSLAVPISSHAYPSYTHSDYTYGIEGRSPKSTNNLYLSPAYKFVNVLGYLECSVSEATNYIKQKEDLIAEKLRKSIHDDNNGVKLHRYFDESGMQIKSVYGLPEDTKYYGDINRITGYTCLTETQFTMHIKELNANKTVKTTASPIVVTLHCLQKIENSSATFHIAFSIYYNSNGHIIPQELSTPFRVMIVDTSML